MPNQLPFTRKTLTLIFGIIVALFIAISSMIMSQKDKQTLEPGNTSSYNSVKKHTTAISAIYHLIKIQNNYEK